MMQIHQQIIPNIRTVGNIIDKFSGIPMYLNYQGQIRSLVPVNA